MRKKFLFAILLCCLGFYSKANNVNIANISVTGNNVSFDLSWENSWNSTNNIDTLYPNNWDAVWIFVKIQSDATNLWSHQNLAQSGHTVTGGGAPLTIESQPDSMGIFIRRTNPGHGNISNASVTLALGAVPSGTTFNVKVFGIEMVHIPSGNFWLGDGNTAGATTSFASQMVTAAKQTSGLAASALYSGSPAVPGTFPMGTNSFYAMKYETTYEQAADFLNTLTYDQQAQHFRNVAPNAVSNSVIFGTGVGAFTSGNYLRIETPGVNNTTPAVVGVNYNGNNVFNEGDDGRDVACVTFNYSDILAYLDWTGLRPMTEFEYEKICRGTRLNGNPVASLQNEYAWGTTSITHYSFNSLTAKDSSTERYVGTVVDGRSMTYNLNTNVSAWPSGTRPARVGVFAEGATGRASSGAGFYGNMNLGDNAAEFVVCVGTNGVGYTSMLGDGILDVNAMANQSTWPVASSTTGLGARGGYYCGSSIGSAVITASRVSNRGNTNASYNGTTQYFVGVRGVR